MLERDTSPLKLVRTWAFGTKPRETLWRGILLPSTVSSCAEAAMTSHARGTRKGRKSPFRRINNIRQQVKCVARELWKCVWERLYVYGI